MICDIQRQKIELIPNDLADIISKLNKKESVKSIKQLFGLKNKEILKSYFVFLLENEYGFYCNSEEYDRFPILNKEYHTASKITNTIIELTTKKIDSLKKTIQQIENLGCKNISIVFYESLSLKNFMDIFLFFKGKRIQSLEITSKFSDTIDETLLIKINNEKNQLTRLTFFNAPNNDASSWGEKLQFDLYYSTSNISSFKSCGVIDSKYFNTNMPKVLEAINFNSCLNRKISIDINGDIKNCPSMPDSFGNIKDTTLENALNHEDFKKYWSISKDQINVCKDCEFRYVCTDCRAYTEKPDDPYSKPLKCGYSPYTNKWEEWSTNPLKQKAIKFFNLHNLNNEI